MENKMKELCKCPYCFKLFSTENVHFKTESVVDQSYIDAADLSEEEEEKMKKYLATPDARFNEFWEQYGGAPQSVDDGEPTYWNEYYNHAVIGFEGSEFAENKPNGEIREQSTGFLKGAVDSLGKETYIRICPHCHNPLPFEYGKYPVMFVAVVGITSSGKTVYLSRLLSEIDNFLLKANLTAVGMKDEVDAFVKQYKIAKNRELPKGNSKHTLTLPLPINVKHNVTDKTFTMIFYDIAGENCVDPKQMAKYGKFIQNANGIIMIVDPKQFSELFTNLKDSPGRIINSKYDDDDYDEDEEDFDDDYDDDEDDDDFDEEDEVEEIERPERVVQAMYNAFASEDKSKIPLAITVSKSDLVEEALGNRIKLRVFENIDYTKYRVKKGFPKKDFMNTTAEVRDLLLGKVTGKECNQGVLLYNNVERNFEKHAFFAVSAVYNAEIVQKMSKKTGQLILVPRNNPETLRIEEPLLWLLYEAGYIEEGVLPAPPKKGLFGR